MQWCSKIPREPTNTGRQFSSIGWSSPIFKPTLRVPLSNRVRPDPAQRARPLEHVRHILARILVSAKFNSHAKCKEFLPEFGTAGFAEDFNCQCPEQFGLLIHITDGCKKDRPRRNHSEWVIKTDYSGLERVRCFHKAPFPSPSCFHTLFICLAFTTSGFSQILRRDPVPKKKSVIIC